MVRKKKSKSNVIDSEGKIQKWLDAEVERTHKTEDEIINETFGDGFMVFIQESGGQAKIDSSQLFKTKSIKETKTIAECQRLREQFAPVSACIDYLKDKLIGGGVGVLIDKPEDTFQKELKEYLTEFVDSVYQDAYTHTLNEILDIMVDEALTTGFSAAEMCYEKTLTFESYASNPMRKLLAVKDAKTGTLKKKEYVSYEVNEPDWKKDKLGGIVRLKIFQNAYNRLKLFRNPKSWLGMYWTVDESVTDDYALTEQGIKLASFGKEYKPPAVRLHTWQLFAVTLNRKNWTERGQTLIINILSTAQILEKILKSIGEGIYRAGNKKYFIICGTEKRPWSSPHIRNVLQELEEASKAGWSTIPVPAGFDIKEAGGEVFEAKTVIEQFLRVIAKGMQCPVDVVGIDSRSAEPVNYNYQRMRDSLKRAIKFQLFAHHIWCEYGKIKGKQGGGFSPVYIPDVKFKMKGVLSDIERLKMDVSLLNVANPINPQLKLEVEKDLAVIMGFDEVLLPTQEELKEELEKLERELAKQSREKGRLPAGQKAQGEPEPQTLERTLKRQKGMQDKSSQKGKSKPLGTRPRVPAEVKKVAETAEDEIPKFGQYSTYIRPEVFTRSGKEPQIIVNTPPITVNIPPPTIVTQKEPEPKLVPEKPKEEPVQESLVREETPEEQIDRQLLRERLEEKLKRDKEERKVLQTQRKKLEKELEGIELGIEETKARKKKVEKEIEARRDKLMVELEEIMTTEETKRDEIKKTQKAKRELMKKIRESIKAEEEKISGGEH